MRRVAVIYNDQPRPETTGLYVRRALGEWVQQGKLAACEHVLPSELERVAPGAFDLFLYVDDGLQRSIREELRPAVWWGIDSHLDFERCLRMASLCDVTLTAQRDGAERLQQAGIKTATWLPLACDPAIHGRVDVPQQYDIAFVGHDFPGKRHDLLQAIQERYPNSFLGQQHYLKLAETYSAAKIVFNRSLRNDINMRVFEGLCSGSLLVTNDLSSNGQEHLIQDGVHYATYREPEELFDKMSFYLKHDEIREQIARNGRQHVLTHHTYRQRMETLLSRVHHDWNAQRVVSPVPELPQKEPFYFEFDRPDVQALVPTTAKQILDIGCGGGRLGEALQRRQRAEVTGIERDPRAAERAERRLQRVVQGDVTADEVNFPAGSFDCVICADVLEHLRHPEQVLQKIRNWLKPEGHLITSLPNVRNHTVVRSLLAGNWTYEPAGLLDEDHVRFFTRREIEKLLFRTGFAIDAMHAVGGEGYEQWVEQGKSLQLAIGPFQLHASSVEDAEEFFAYQYLTRSTPAPRIDDGLTSIILVTHNQLSYTKECLESIRLRTIAPYEIIVVDNGSTDRTVDYLQECPDVLLIQNQENRGFPAAVNQGIAQAQGENILLLNNDTLVTTGWLERLLSALHAEDEIGLVGPLSNNVSGPQQIAVNYDHLAQLDGFAWELAKRQRNVRIPTARLVGFCLLMKRQVVDRIGLFDERFGIGNFEDDDYCRRAQAAGFRCEIATDAFVHHFGSVTFRASGVNFGELLQTNQQLYEQKWEHPSQAPSHSTATDDQSGNRLVQKRSPRLKFLFDQTEEGALILKENSVRLSACLIVRDNERTIRPCLETLSPWVDEIVVVDTGSKDRTAAICAEWGARVFHWPWRDDFAAARNESLRYARGDWIFWMDSDDTLPAECGQQLQRLVNGTHKEHVLGYVMQVHCPGAEATDVTVVDHVKLFRNLPELNFEFRIHEQILPAIRRAGGEVEFTDIYVVHSGATKDVAGKRRKLERDFKLLHLELQDRPDHPFTLFNLGMTHADCGQHAEAVHCLTRCLQVSGRTESHVRKAYALLVNSLNQSGHEQTALHTCQVALSHFPGDKELLFRRALLEHQTGQLEAAVETYHQVLEERTDRHFTSIDTGISGHKARHNLAVVYEELGQLEASQKQWQFITQSQPDYRAGWRGLVDILLKRNLEETAREVVLWLQHSPDHTVIGHILAAQLAERTGEIDKAIATLKCLLSTVEGDFEALDVYCRVLVENGRLVEALDALQRLLSIAPDDPATHHNLAVVYERCGEPALSAKHIERASQLHPQSLGTEDHFRSLNESAESNRTESYSQQLVRSPIEA